MIEDGELNLQTERIENHRAQLTIEIEEDQLTSAKQKAARQISQRVRIKGFRKGKAPYRIVAQHVGEAAILEEAIDSLGEELYKQALEESEVNSYGPGAFEDFKLEPAPTFVFTVPLQPEVELNNYQDVRIDFEEPEVPEELVNEALQRLRLLDLEVLNDQCEVAELGNRVTLSVDSEFLDGEEPDADEPEIDGDETEQSDETDETDDADGEPDDVAWNEEDDMPYVPRKGDTFVHDENAIVILDPSEDPFLDGFVEAIVGAELGSDIEFELTVPDDDADKTIANRQVYFVVTVKKIESIRIPDLDDAFAEKSSKNRGAELMDMAALRENARRDMERMALDQAKSDYSGQVLEQIVAGAEIHYPELLLEDRIDAFVEEFEDGLKQRNLRLEDFYRYSGETQESFRLRFHEQATQSLEESLVTMELIKEEEVEVADEHLDLRMNLAVAGLGNSPEVRKIMDTPEMRANHRSELFISQLNERLWAIGRGEDPDEAVDSYFAQLRDDLKLARESFERLRGYVDSEELPDSDDFDEDESDDDMSAVDPERETVPTSEAQATARDAGDASDEEAGDLDKSKVGE